MPIFDVIIVGAGLVGSLALYRLSQTHPHLKILLVDRNEKMGGEHTWSFHEKDISSDAAQWLLPMLSKIWDEQSVRFPAHSRKIETRYASIRSERLHSVVSRACGEKFMGGAEVTAVSPHRVTLSDGKTLDGHVVIDARGFDAFRPESTAYQKFVGWDVTLSRPHGLTGPVIMDATVEQKDGYRFIYLLPWDAWSVLIEDTRYSDNPDIDRAEYGEEIQTYAENQGWQIASWDREEVGVLPIPLRKDFGIDGDPAVVAMRSGQPTMGVKAGLFHPTTGYSLPDAVRTVEALATITRWDPIRVATELQKLQSQGRNNRAFYRLLNQWMFWGATAKGRYRILERFYTLDSELIGRFYAGESTVKDWARILIGRPPIPVTRALYSLHKAWWGSPAHG
jgi:lycopene beta-cyclase